MEENKETRNDSERSSTEGGPLSSERVSLNNQSLPKEERLLDSVEQIVDESVENLQKGEVHDLGNDLANLRETIDFAYQHDILEGDILQNIDKEVANLKDRESTSIPGNFSIEEREYFKNKLENIRAQIKNELGQSEDVVTEKAILERLNEKEKTLEQEREKLNELEKRLKEKERGIDKTFEDVSNRKSDLEEAQAEAEDLEETYSSLVQWEAGEAIGGEFKDQKEGLENSLQFWLIGSILSIIFLLGFSFLLYSDISSQGGNGYLVISKVSLLLPVSIAVWFFVSNYSRQKKLMREYEFKESMAKSFRGFLEMLREDMSEEERPEIGNFVVNTMDRIYSNPQENISNKEGADEESGPLSQGAVASIIENMNNRK